jgi:hypothetical protein
MECLQRNLQRLTSERAAAYADDLRRRGLVLPDGTLSGPPEQYCMSELWAYVRSLWHERSDTNHALRAMTGKDGTFDARRAEESVRAALVNNRGDREGVAQALLPRHMHNFLQVLAEGGIV